MGVVRGCAKGQRRRLGEAVGYERLVVTPGCGEMGGVGIGPGGTR